MDSHEHLLQQRDERIRELERQNEEMRRVVVEMQAAAEREGEYISNNLLRRIESLKAEKEQLLTQVEREEEYLTNTLQRQLAQLRQEKIELETAMEREQEFIINRLQQQVDQLGLPAFGMRRRSDASTVGSAASSTTSASGSRDAMRMALQAEQARVRELESLNKSLRFDLESERARSKLLQSKFDALRQSTTATHANAEREDEYLSNTLLRRISSLQNDKAHLLAQLEQEETYMNSVLSRRVAQLTEEKKHLEAALESERSGMQDRLQRQLDALQQAAQAGGAAAGQAGDLYRADIETLRKQLRALQESSTAVEASLQREVRALKEELQRARTENVLLRQRILQGADAMRAIAQSKMDALLVLPPEPATSQRPRIATASPADMATRSSARARSVSLPEAARHDIAFLHFPQPQQAQQGTTHLPRSRSGSVRASEVL